MAANEEGKEMENRVLEKKDLGALDEHGARPREMRCVIFFKRCGPSVQRGRGQVGMAKISQTVTRSDPFITSSDTNLTNLVGFEFIGTVFST